MSLCVFNVFKMFNINQSILEIIGFLLIIIPTGLISVYYTRVIKSSLNENNNKTQLLIRKLFHLFFIIFILFSIFIFNTYNYFIFLV
jgi:hypothetical protein